LKVASSQIGENSNNEKNLLVSIRKTIIPNIYLVQKPTFGNIISHFPTTPRAFDIFNNGHPMLTTKKRKLISKFKIYNLTSRLAYYELSFHHILSRKKGNS
jgi:hypothetical protein